MEDRNLSNVYIGVIMDVVSKVSEDFVNSEAGEEVLNELQATWKEKMLQSGVVSNRPPSRRSITPLMHSVDDQNAPCEGLSEKYETPTAEILFPPISEENMLQSGVISNKPPSRRSITPFVHTIDDQNAPYEGLSEKYEIPTAEIPYHPTSLQTPMKTSLHSDQGTYNLRAGQSNYIHSAISDCKNSPDDEIWRHNPCMQLAHSMNEHQDLGVDVNVAHEKNHDHEDIGDSTQPLARDRFMMASRKRKRYDNPASGSLGCQMLEQDGSGDVTIEFILPKSNQFKKSKGTEVTPVFSTKGGPVASLLPQEDNLDFHGVASVDHNTHTDQGQWGD